MIYVTTQIRLIDKRRNTQSFMQEYYSQDWSMVLGIVLSHDVVFHLFAHAQVRSHMLDSFMHCHGAGGTSFLKFSIFLNFSGSWEI